jgi:hypothetical protein
MASERRCVADALRVRLEGEPRDYKEEALADFRHHKMDALGWIVVRPHPREG